jgi:hypothetical protein
MRYTIYLKEHDESTEVEVSKDVYLFINRLDMQIIECEKCLTLMNDKVVGREYGLDAEHIWDICKDYYSKYKTNE